MKKTLQQNAKITLKCILASFKLNYTFEIDYFPVFTFRNKCMKRVNLSKPLNKHNKMKLSGDFQGAFYSIQNGWSQANIGTGIGSGTTRWTGSGPNSFEGIPFHANSGMFWPIPPKRNRLDNYASCTPSLSFTSA